MIYRNPVKLTEKPVWYQTGLKCLYLVLGDHDRVGLLLVCWPPCCPTLPLPDLASLILDVWLQSPRPLVLGDINMHAKAGADNLDNLGPVTRSICYDTAGGGGGGDTYS